MHILLPPSETKVPGGGFAFSAAGLQQTQLLGTAREAIRTALVELCGDEAAAIVALKLGKKSQGELAHNLVLDSSLAMPAIERYTGVLYDALDTATLEPAARAWVDTNVSVQSALFGQIGAADHIPAYRLSASTRLPGLSIPLKRVWREAHSELDWPARGWTLDLRSQDYVELAPMPADAGAFLSVMQRSASGEVRALNHFNKAAKGDLVRRLASSHAVIDSERDFFDWASAHGVELIPSEKPGDIVLVTDLGAPK